MFDSLKDWLEILIDGSFKRMNGAIKDAVDILNKKDDLWTDMMAMLEDPNEYILQPFCYTIVGICLLIELLQTASKADIMKWEQGLKIGIKMVLAKVCIDEAPKFLEACYLQSLKWIGEFATDVDVLNINELVSKACKWSVSQISGMGNILGLFTVFTLVFLAINVCGLIITMTAYGRMFEIYSYLIISPLPFAFLPLGTGDGFGINRMTANFIKNFIAACVQGVMMVIALYVYKKMFGLSVFVTQLGQILGTVWDGLVSILTFGFGGPSEVEIMTSIMEMSFFMLLHAILQVVIVTKCSGLAKSMINAM